MTKCCLGNEYCRGKCRDKLTGVETVKKWEVLEGGSSMSCLESWCRLHASLRHFIVGVPVTTDYDR